MVEEVKKRTQEALIYERAKYRVHDTDDPALKEYYRDIIKAYEKSHPKKTEKTVVLPEKQR